jgi:hypothetical protein
MATAQLFSHLFSWDRRWRDDDDDDDDNNVDTNRKF